MSGGYTAGMLKQVCMEVITAKRIEAIRRGYRLKTVEFVKRLAAQDPIYVDEERAFLQWYTNTPLAKKRHQRLIQEGILNPATMSTKNKKGKGKGKKKGGKKNKGKK